MRCALGAYHTKQLNSPLKALNSNQCRKSFPRQHENQRKKKFSGNSIRNHDALTKINSRRPFVDATIAVG